jgi:hypothetical protein
MNSSQQLHEVAFTAEPLLERQDMGNLFRLAAQPRHPRDELAPSAAPSRNLAPQAVGEGRKHIGKLSRGFRCRQRHFEISRTGGWIALNPWMRCGVGIAGDRQSGNKL